MDGPHICGFSPDAVCSNFTSVLASARRVGSAIELINAVTLSSVGLVWFSAIRFWPFGWCEGLLQLLVLGLRGFEDWNIRVRVFPRREEVLVCRPGLGLVALQRVGSA